MHVTNDSYCDLCGATLKLHADGCVTCECYFLESRPLGRIPRFWHLSNEYWELLFKLAPHEQRPSL